MLGFDRGSGTKTEYKNQHSFVHRLPRSVLLCFWLFINRLMVQRRVFPSSINLVHEIACCIPNGAYGSILYVYNMTSIFPLHLGVFTCVCAWLTRVPRVQCWYAAYFVDRERIFIWLMFLFSCLLQTEKKKKMWKHRYRCRQSEGSRDWSLCVWYAFAYVCVCVGSQVGLTSHYLYSQTSAGCCQGKKFE